MSAERRHLGRIVRLAIVIAATASVIAPPAATAAAPQTPARYCHRYDAYELQQCSAQHALPDGSLGRQLGWTLDQLGGGAATLTVAEVRAHLTASLRQVMPARALVQLFRRTLIGHGPMTFVGFSYPPRSGQAAALVESPSGERGAVALGVRGGLIDSLELDEAPPTIVPHGPHSGLFDVGGRRVFLRCTGTGTPTVVFENGLVSDWYQLQNQLTPLARICSYDPARMAGAWGRSDPAPAPRDGIDRVRDLHALLRAANVPGPYVLAGHSNGGLFSLLYASRHPRQVAGLVLIDGVHPAYHRRSIKVAERFVPRERWDEIIELACGLAPIQLDAEQMDICRAEAQTRRALAITPPRPVPLAVLSRGHQRFPVGTPEYAQEHLWRRLQGELAAMAPGSRHIVARGSGHDIQHDRPGLVLRQVTDVVTAVRAGSTRLDSVDDGCGDPGR